MKIYSFSRILFPTHVGKSGTNDNYIYIPKNQQIINGLFTSRDSHLIQVTDTLTGHIDEMLVSYPRNGAECRVAGEFAEFVRRHQLTSGDEIIFQHVLNVDRTSQYFLSYKKNTNKVTLHFKPSLKIYIIENDTRISSLVANLPQTLEIVYQGTSHLVQLIDGGLQHLKANSAEQVQTYLMQTENLTSWLQNTLILEQVEGTRFKASDFIPWTYTNTIATEGN